MPMKRVTIDFALFAAMLGVILPAMPAKCDSFGSGANAFDIEFVPIGNSGNIADTTGTPRPRGVVGL